MASSTAHHTRCSVLQRVAVCHSVLQAVAVIYSVLQAVAVCSRPRACVHSECIMALNAFMARWRDQAQRTSMLQRVAGCCSMLQTHSIAFMARGGDQAQRTSTSQCVAVCCRLLQCVAYEGPS